MDNCENVPIMCRQQNCGLIWACFFLSFLINVWQCGIRQKDKKKIKQLQNRSSFLEGLSEDIAEEVIIPEAEIVEG